MGDSEAALNLGEIRQKIQVEAPARRRELLEGFASQPGEEVDRLLISFMEDPSAEVRRTVVGIMRRRGLEDRDFYSRAAEDTSALVKRTAMAALKSLEKLHQRQKTLSLQLFRRIGVANADRLREESYFVRLLQSKEKETRADALRRLGDVPTPWATQLLLRGLRDESWTNRTVAVQLLGRRDDVCQETLYERLHDPLWYLRSTAVEVLGLRQETGAVEKMVHLTRDSNVEVRCALADSLGCIGGEAAARLLELLLADKNFTVRTKAEKAIKSIRRLTQEKA